VDVHKKDFDDRRSERERVNGERHIGDGEQTWEVSPLLWDLVRASSSDLWHGNFAYLRNGPLPRSISIHCSWNQYQHDFSDKILPVNHGAHNTHPYGEHNQQVDHGSILSGGLKVGPGSDCYNPHRKKLRLVRQNA
jgi:hypothetical protein